MIRHGASAAWLVPRQSNETVDQVIKDLDRPTNELMTPDGAIRNHPMTPDGAIRSHPML